MKKILKMTLMVVLILALTAFVYTPGFADSEGTVTKMEFTIGVNTIHWPMNYPTGTMGAWHTEFTAPYTCTYTFTNNTEGASIRIGKFDEFGCPVLRCGESYELYMFEGETIPMQIYNDYCLDYDFDIVFTIDVDSLDAIYADWTRIQLGENEVDVGENFCFDGLPCVYIAQQTGIYRITSTDDNAYIMVDGENLIGAGASKDVVLQVGTALEVMVATDSMEADMISFTFEAISLTKSELTVGQNNIFVPFDDVTYGLDCTFVPDVTGVYVFTPVSENAMISVNNGSWLRYGESLELTLAAGDNVTVDVTDVNGEEGSVVFDITLKEAVTNHEYEAVVTAPNCSEQGYTTYTCKICGDSYRDDYVDPTGIHEFKYPDGHEDPTCTEDGFETMACICGETETTVLPKIGHTEGTPVEENRKEATCTEDGAFDTVIYCTTCQAEISRTTTTVTAAGHDEAEAVKENETHASCATDGKYDMVVYCKTCGAEIGRKTTVVPATGAHVYANETDRKEATCTEDGFVTKACGCGETETTVLPKTGHNPAEAVKEKEVAATCTTDGSYDTVVKCLTCGAEISRETVKITATGHKEAAAVKENEVVASCNSNGSYDLVVYCQVCKAELSRKTETVKATGDHVFATETERKDPTCTEDGYAIMACGCGTTDTVVLPKTGHTAAEAVKENEVNATCKTDGSYDQVVYCQNCQAEMSRETVAVPATGEHVYATETERKEATCTEVGFVIMACGCGETQTTELPIAEHVAAEAVKENEVAATCTAEGSYDLVVKCAACGVEMSRQSETVAATGHSFGEWETVTEPTATEDGSKKRVCACGEEETEVIPALGEPETKPTEPETKPTEPATKPTEPATKPTEPVTKPSEPNITPTAPATQPGDTDNEGGNLTTIIIIAVVVVAIAIVAFVVIKKKK